jgi:hypothetical protein
VGRVWLCERALFVEWVLLATAATAESATTAASRTRTSESFFNGLSFLGATFATYSPPIPPGSGPMIFLCSGAGILKLQPLMDFQIASLSPYLRRGDLPGEVLSTNIEWQSFSSHPWPPTWHHLGDVPERHT